MYMLDLSMHASVLMCVLVWYMLGVTLVCVHMALIVYSVCHTYVYTCTQREKYAYIPVYSLRTCIHATLHEGYQNLKL